MRFDVVGSGSFITNSSRLTKHCSIDVVFPLLLSKVLQGCVVFNFKLQTSNIKQSFHHCFTTMSPMPAPRCCAATGHLTVNSMKMRPSGVSSVRVS